MRRTRVIPILLIHKEGVYKTKSFKDPRYIGDPINANRLFNDLEADEIIVLDIDASKANRSSDLEIIEDIVSEAFMPVSFGGGIDNSDLARKILNLGVEKIIINKSAQQNDDVLMDCINRFGSSSVIGCVDYKKDLHGENRQFDHVKSSHIDSTLLEAVERLQSLGVGEIMINSVDRDGMMNGLDISTIKEITPTLDIPLIVCGGAESIDDLKKASEAGANAIAAGSMFVFLGKLKGVMINYPSEQILNKYLK